MKIMKRTLCRAIAMTLLIAAVPAPGLEEGPAASARGGQNPVLYATRLRCEYLVNPPGVDVKTPRLSWVMKSDRRGDRQTAYQVLVASTPELLARDKGDLWDSGKVQSDETLNVVYNGKPLHSRLRCHWKVLLYDKDGKASPWSKPAMWSMGLLEKNDWKAKWITDPISATNRPAERYRREGLHHVFSRDPVTKKPFPPQPAVMLRREFDTASGIRRATAYVTARGLYELRINGQRVGDQQLAPGWTDYNLRVYYQTDDVTGLLREGENAIAALLGPGWYSGELGPLRLLGRRLYGPCPQLLLQLEIERADGSRQTIVSDESWTATQDGPILLSEIYLGEDYDARKEMPGWDRAGFDDSAWQPAVAQELDETRLQAQDLEPIRITRTIDPVSVRKVAEDVYQFDLGQTMVGWCRMRVKGKAGQKINLRHFELLDGNGRGSTKTLFGARAAENYILGGNPEGEMIEPRFTYHGFRYVEVTGLGYEPGKDDLAGCVVRSDAPLTGSFESSHEVANKLMHASLWTQMGNMHSVPTDCPQRIERLGWMGDIQAFAPTAMYNMDMGAFFSKWIADIRGGQFTNGAYTVISPFHFLGTWNKPIKVRNKYYGPWAAAPGWSDAGTIVPWWYHVYYGDRRLLEQHFESARRWVDYIHENNPDTLLFTNGRGAEYGDWLPAGRKLEIDIFATAFFARSAWCVARMADALGRSDDSRRYTELFERIRSSFQERYINEDAGMKTGAPVAGIALAMCFDLYPEAQRAQAAQHMVDAIGGGTLPTGIQTSHRVMLELTRNGYHEEACRIMNLHAKPSWGFMMDQGATTIWENWKGTTSQNHFALGSVCEWIWRHIAGIAPDENAPGFKHIIIQPRPGPGFTWAKAEYESIRGPITTDWRVEDGTFTLKITIPPNTTATVRVPTKDARSVQESDTPADRREGRTFLRAEKDAIFYEVESGSYEFEASYDLHK